MFYKTSFLLSVLISVSGLSQNTFVPDDSFEQALIDLGLDSGPLDDLVPTANINGITTLDLEAKNISDLAGIEGFTALEELNCKDNLLTNIDVSNNQNLLTLWCDNNLLNTIDISNNSSLSQLFVKNNQLTNLDVTNNQNLLILWCDNNLLNTIDISQNPELISLTCGGNLISTLNLSVNTKLNVLVCDDNQISNLDLSANTTLNRLQCADNLLTSLNISQNPDISVLYCFNNQITNLDISQNLNLIEFDCNNNLLSEFDLSNNSRLTRINCSQNNLCSLNIRNGNNVDITDLDFSLNPDLNCVIVDSPNAINSNWLPLNFLNYVNTADACEALILVDEIDDFIGTSYTLPTLLNGNYHTEPNGNGIQLFAGDTITTTQTIYIFNSTQCYTNESSFHVLISNDDYYIPKYFTPNNDSSHDTWRVIDNTGSFISINIYDRYGKLLKSLVPNNFEWDGTFNGNLLNTDDYWFVINRGSEIPIKGHFTLKR